MPGNLHLAFICVLIALYPDCLYMVIMPEGQSEEETGKPK